MMAEEGEAEGQAQKLRCSQAEGYSQEEGCSQAEGLAQDNKTVAAQFWANGWCLGPVMN